MQGLQGFHSRCAGGRSRWRRPEWLGPAGRVAADVGERCARGGADELGWIVQQAGQRLDSRNGLELAQPTTRRLALQILGIIQQFDQ